MCVALVFGNLEKYFKIFWKAFFGFSSRPLLRRRLPVIRTSETTGQMALLLLNPAQTAENPPGLATKTVLFCLLDLKIHAV